MMHFLIVTSAVRLFEQPFQILDLECEFSLSTARFLHHPERFLQGYVLRHEEHTVETLQILSGSDRVCQQRRLGYGRILAVQRGKQTRHEIVVHVVGLQGPHGQTDDRGIVSAQKMVDSAYFQNVMRLGILNWKR